MATVSISEASRLVNVSRPTLYKMLNAGKLNYTSVVKKGKALKQIDTSELMRVFGALTGVKKETSEDVNDAVNNTVVNTGVLQDLQHQIALLKAENEGLKEAVSARDEHISSLRQAMYLLEDKTEPQQTERRVLWWRFWKNGS